MEVIFIFKDIDASISMKLKPGLIQNLLKSSVKSVKARIIYLSLLFFIYVVMMVFTIIHIHDVNLFPPYLNWWVTVRIDLIRFSLFSCTRLYSCAKTTFVLILSSRYVSGGFSLVDCSPCILMFRCPIVVFLDFSRCLLIIVLVRPGRVFRNPYLMALTRLSVVGMNSDACKYCARYGFDVCAIILFITDDGC